MSTQSITAGFDEDEESAAIDDELLEEFAAFRAAKRAAAQRPAPAPAPVPLRQMFMRPHENTPDSNVLRQDIRREMDRGSGLVGRWKQHIMGDPLQREQLDDLKRRLKAVSDVQRGELAKDVIAATRTKGVKAVTNAIGEQDNHVNKFGDASNAGEVGRMMIERNMRTLPDLEDMISSSVERKVVEELGFDR